jgi:hypothetical protein
LFAINFSILIIGVKINVQKLNLQLLRALKPCGENVAYWSTGQLPTGPRSATQPISFTFAPGPLVTLLEGQFSLVGRQPYSAHSTA